ncbi:UNVERIFIED_ORG: protein-S-isoprenylcysteine O-methyltransferase Ste14 [Shinella zoogloeoides]|nr:protein-S-isoprenylcysteine O-methyltransferase Ste14 [Shinella zoogloeoides]
MIGKGLDPPVTGGITLARRSSWSSACPPSPRCPATLRVAGLALAGLGALFAAYAQHYMGASWRIGSAEGQSGAIFDTGPFRRSRNPVFVGQVALFTGFVVARPDIVQLALAAAVVLAVWLQVRVEEKVLERDLGEPYAAYRERVRRWL